ncbi:hypothetical protein NDU88_003148 [Pleurodeles waltl]|uniref:Uncharacterized protein n=1 Tax=Pleurodeles waltl TaxID=8319 RepID=A0AAV7VEJ8_PLEWA|nr:hypothetical protein NDU88_003148 [Pleurodeles waltl]
MALKPPVLQYKLIFFQSNRYLQNSVEEATIMFLEGPQLQTDLAGKLDVTGDPDTYTEPRSRFPGGTSEGETSPRTCVTTEAEGDARWRKQEEKSPKKTSSILDWKERSEEEQSQSEDKRGAELKEPWRKDGAKEENRDSDLSTEDKAKKENANTDRHVP